MKNKILVMTRGGIPYIKEVRELAKSVTATILMQQLDYWFDKKPNGFYKFKSPCNHANYMQGDSWEEELFFSEEEFTTAFSKIGHSYKSKTEFDNSLDKFSNKFYCSYFDRKTCLTYYYRNHDLLDSELERISTNRQVRNTETDKYGIQKPTSTESPYNNITETTQKNTSDIKTNKKEINFEQNNKTLEPSLSDTLDNSSSYDSSLSKKEKVPLKRKGNFDTAEQSDYLSLPEWSNLSEYEKEKTLWYINQRKLDHGSIIKNTPKAIKPILSAILELKSKGLTIDDIMKNIQGVNGLVYQTIKAHYFDNALRQIKAQNNTNSPQNEQSYQTTQNNAQKVPLNDDEQSDNYFAYRFNEAIEPAFSYRECVELTESIEKSNPSAKKYARTIALIQWLKDKPNHELTPQIKKEIIEIYNLDGYEEFTNRNILGKQKSVWTELLELLFN